MSFPYFTHCTTNYKAINHSYETSFRRLKRSMVALALQDSIVEKIGVQLCGRTVNSLRFSDDTNPIAESQDQLQTEK